MRDKDILKAIKEKVDRSILKPKENQKALGTETPRVDD